MKYLGPSWFKQLLARLVPDPAIQRLRKAIFDVEAESKKILLEKRTAIGAGDEQLALKLSEGKDLMSILCMSLHSNQIHNV